MVYFLSKTNMGWKRITSGGTNKDQITVQKKGVLTIKLHNQGRGGNTK